MMSVNFTPKSVRLDVAMVKAASAISKVYWRNYEDMPFEQQIGAVQLVRHYMKFNLDFEGMAEKLDIAVDVLTRKRNFSKMDDWKRADAMNVIIKKILATQG